MPPLVVTYLILAAIIYPLAWFKGGAPERWGAVICVVGSVGATALQNVMLGENRIGEAVLDVITLAIFLRMSLVGRRWWPLAASACMLMMLIVHLSTALMPSMTSRADIVARLGLSVLLELILAAGVLERWLAGEAPGAGRFNGMIRNRVLNI